MCVSNKHLNDIYTQQNMRTIELLDNAEDISRCLTLTFTYPEKPIMFVPFFIPGQTFQFLRGHRVKMLDQL